MNIKVIIVDDHEIVRFGVRSLFETFKDLSIEVVGEADNGRQGVDLTCQIKP
ncbi:MAG: DNA-binding response regulator, partial [Anaerohalosphaeraceae bacterium]